MEADSKGVFERVANPFRNVRFSLSIAALAMVVVVGLGLLALGGTRAWSAWNERETTQSMVDGNRILDKLFDASTDWALERGLTQLALHEAGPADAATLKRIKAARLAGDKAMADARNAIRMRGDVHPQWIAAFDSADRTVTGDRTLADVALTLPADQRSKRLLATWMADASKRIEASQGVRAALAASLGEEGALGKLMTIKENAWIVSEYGARERATLASAAADGQPLDWRALEQIAFNRGKVELAWSTLREASALNFRGTRMAGRLPEVERAMFDNLADSRRGDDRRRPRRPALSLLRPRMVRPGHDRHRRGDRPVARRARGIAPAGRRRAGPRPPRTG